MKKLLYISIFALIALSCKKQDDKEAMTPQLRVESTDTVKTDPNEGKVKFTLFASKVPYWFNRPDKSGVFHADKCTTQTTVFYEEYVDPTKTVGGVSFGGYTFQASYNSTNSRGDTISIKCEYGTKSVIGTSNKENNALAFVRLKDLK